MALAFNELIHKLAFALTKEINTDRGNYYNKKKELKTNQSISFNY